MPSVAGDDWIALYWQNITGAPYTEQIKEGAATTVDIAYTAPAATLGSVSDLVSGAASGMANGALAGGLGVANAVGYPIAATIDAGKQAVGWVSDAASRAADDLEGVGRWYGNAVTLLMILVAAVVLYFIFTAGKTASAIAPALGGSVPSPSVTVGA